MLKLSNFIQSCFTFSKYEMSDSIQKCIATNCPGLIRTVQYDLTSPRTMAKNSRNCVQGPKDLFVKCFCFIFCQFPCLAKPVLQLIVPTSLVQWVLESLPCTMFFLDNRLIVALTQYHRLGARHNPSKYILLP